MKIELLATPGIKGAFKELKIQATRTYKSTNAPHFEVWEIEKNDLFFLEETLEWHNGWGHWAYSKGSNMGSAYNFLTVNNEFLIGWETQSGADTYDALSDYLYDGMGVHSHEEVCSMAVGLARANGKNLAQLFATYQG